MSRGPHARDAYGLTAAQRLAFSDWLSHGRTTKGAWDGGTVQEAKRKLGFDGFTAVECLPRVMTRMPDLIDPQSEMGRVLAVLLRRREAS